MRARRRKSLKGFDLARPKIGDASASALFFVKRTSGAVTAPRARVR